MTIGKIAKKTALNVQTIRFYERAGLLEEAKRTPAGYRQFEENTVERIQFIRKAQKIGYSLEEIRELLSLSVSEENPCDRVRLMTEAKIAEVEIVAVESARARARLIAGGDVVPGDILREPIQPVAAKKPAKIEPKW